MTSWSFAKPAPIATHRMSNQQSDIAALHQNATDLENEIADLNRQITAAVVAELASGGLSGDLAAIVEARDKIRARLHVWKQKTIADDKTMSGKPNGAQSRVLDRPSLRCVSNLR